MIVFAVQPAVPPALAQAPARTLQARVRALLEATGAADWSAVRSELKTALAVAERQQGRLQPLPLTLRALAGLVLDRQGEERGLRLFAEACGGLHRQLLLMQRIHGAESLETVPYLESLQELYHLEKLNGDRWEDQALRAALRHSREPRPDLEKRLVAAIERHYGPFLSFRPPDRPALLEDVALLLSLWERRQNPPGATREFMEVGLRGDAKGVWKQVAAHAGEPLRERLRQFLAGLDPQQLMTDPDGFLAWLPAQAPAPWQAAARRLAEAADAVLAKAALPPAAILRRRVRLARAMGDNGRAATMVIEALAGSEEDRSAVFALAAEQLREQEDPALIRPLHQALLADLPRLAAEEDGRSLLAGAAQRLEAAGDWGSAEVFWRALLGGQAASAPTGGAWGAGAAEHALGQNLAAQGRWEEARFFLEPQTAAEKWQSEPTLRFQLAAVETGRGDQEAALRRAREGLALLPAEGPIRPMPGLAAALRLLAGDAASGGLVKGVADRLRLSLDPDGLVPALQDAGTLLALAAGLEQQTVQPPVLAGTRCGGPWTAVGEDPVTKGMALLQAARGLRPEDAEPCLREALENLEQALHDPDPRLQLPLLRLGICLQEREDAGAEAVYRRVLANAAAAPAEDPLLELEARARLGQLLSEQGRDEEADALLHEALGRLLRAPMDDPKVLEMLGGVVLMRIARLEYREQYLEAAQVLEQVEHGLAKDGQLPGKEIKLETDLRELTGPKARFQRQARLQVLLRSQGLP